jgi:hypothetical protein
VSERKQTELSGGDPSVRVTKDKRQARISVMADSGDEDIHLVLTAWDALQLLNLLQEAQRHGWLPAPTTSDAD